MKERGPYRKGIEGAGFATTTRDQAGALIRVETWDAPDGWCGDGTPR